MTTRLALRIAATGLLVLCGRLPAGAETFIYVSNANDGTIATFRMLEGGALEPGEKVAVADLVMPMAVNPEGTILYAGVRSEPFSVYSFAIDQQSGALERLAVAPLPDNMLYLSTDRTGKYLFSASNSGDLVAVNALGPDGAVSAEPIQVVETGDDAHAILIDGSNRFVFTPTLAADAVEQFTFDAAKGRLAHNDPATVSTGEAKGPRHFTIAPDDRHVYVASQFLAEVIGFSIDETTGRLTWIGAYDGLPGNTRLHPGVVRPPVSGKGPLPPDPDAIWAADIGITANGRFVYLSERTTSQLIRFRRDPDSGALDYIGAIATERQPRGFAIDDSGSYLVAAGEKSGHIAVYAINGEDGDLSELGRYESGTGANWVEIVTTK